MPSLLKTVRIDLLHKTESWGNRCWARVCWYSCWVGAARQSMVRNTPDKWFEFLIHLPAVDVDCSNQAVPTSCLLLSRRVARREEKVLALSGVLQTRRANIMLPAVSPCCRERGRGVNFVRAQCVRCGWASASSCYCLLVLPGPNRQCCRRASCCLAVSPGEGKLCQCQ